MMLRAAKAPDVPFIRALVRRPENAAFLTDEDDAALLAYVSDPTARLLIWGQTRPQGFALFCDVGDPSGAVQLTRLALDTPGEGHGGVFLRALIDHAFDTLRARRLWLDATGENLRA